MPRLLCWGLGQPRQWGGDGATTGCSRSSDEEFQATREGSDQMRQRCVRSGPERQTQGHTAATEGCPRVPPRAPFWPPAPPVSSLSWGPDLCPHLCCFPSRELGLKSPVHTSDSGRHRHIAGRLPPLQPPNSGPRKGTGAGGRAGA